MTAGRFVKVAGAANGEFDLGAILKDATEAGLSAVTAAGLKPKSKAEAPAGDCPVPEANPAAVWLMPQGRRSGAADQGVAGLPERRQSVRRYAGRAGRL